MPSWKRVIISGSDAALNSLEVTQNVVASSFTGSLQGTASFALDSALLDGTGSAVFATTGSNVFIGDQIISGSLEISGSIDVTDTVQALLLSGSLRTDRISFTQQGAFTGTQGDLGYSFDDGRFTFFIENDVPIELGQTLYARVRNADSVVLTKGTIVDFTADTTGQIPRVKRAIATSGADCSCFIGVVLQDIGINEFGAIMMNGIARGLNLTAFNTDDQLYLSATVSGSATTTIPTPPVKAIRIGKVLNGSASPTQGVLYVRPENRTVYFDLDNFKQTYNTGSFTGSFVGDGSGLINLPTGTAGSSITHTQATPAFTWSFNHGLNTRNPLLQVYNENHQQIIPNEIVGINPFVAEIRFDYEEAGFAIASTGGVIEITGSTPRLVQTTPQLTWSFEHNLGTKYPGFEVFDDTDAVIIPDGIQVIDENTAEIYFATPTSGVVIANFSGIDGTLQNAISASYAATASYSDQFNIGATQTQYASVTSSINGSNVLFDLATGSFTSAFFKYTVASGSNARSGEVMSVWNNTNIAFTDNSTTDIGTTTPVTSSVELAGSNIQFNIQTATEGWVIKSIATFI